MSGCDVPFRLEPGVRATQERKCCVGYCNMWEGKPLSLPSQSPVIGPNGTLMSCALFSKHPWFTVFIMRVKMCCCFFFTDAFGCSRRVCLFMHAFHQGASWGVWEQGTSLGTNGDERRCVVVGLKGAMA